MSRLVSVLAACRTPEDQARAEAICAAQTYPNIELVAPELGRDYDAIYNDGSQGCAEIHVATYLAHGDYYAHLFPGDTFHPDHVARLIELLEVTKANFAYSQLAYGQEVVGSDPPRFGEISASTIICRAQLSLAENWRDGGLAFEWDLVTRWIGLGAKWAYLPRITVERPREMAEDTSPTPLKQGVVIGTTSMDSPWLKDCLDSLRDSPYPVEVYQTPDFEPATIKWASEHFDEFLFLPETSVVKDLGLLDLIFKEHAGRSVNLGSAQGSQFRMFLGKYRSQAIRELGIPQVSGKAEAIHQEIYWCEAYARKEELARRLVSVGAPLEHSAVFEQRHGRMNMVVENEYLRKWKGTVYAWSGDSDEVKRKIRELLPV